VNGFGHGRAFHSTISQRWSEGLCSLVVIFASRFRNCVCTERNRMLLFLPVDSATACARNGIASEAQVRKGGAKGRG
jgi:hypothetical protein